MASFDNFPEFSFKQLHVIPFQTYTGSLNMAIDLYLSKLCRQSEFPILRFYGWKPYCISIGHHQIRDILDFEKINKAEIGFVKRPTGGRAILHAEELTYSIVCTRNIFHHKTLYHFIHKVIADGLIELGFAVDIKTDNEKLPGLTHKANDFPCFTKSAQTEVQYNDKKLIGSAQKIYEDVILQHGSILIGKEHQQLANFINVSNSEKEKISRDIREKTICLKEIKSGYVSQEKITKSIINQLELVRGISVNSRTLSRAEISQARKFEAQFMM